MKCVIFGGGGFIGSAVADRLLLDGHALRIFERPRVEPFRAFHPHEEVQWTTGDFLSMHDVGNAVQGMDAVVHLVSTTLPKTSNDDPVYDVQTNVIASLQMIEAMVLHKVQRIIFISSGGTVYGKPRSVPISELHPTEPEVSYGITKLTIEKYLHLFGHLHGGRAIILRVANPFGARQRVQTAQGAVAAFLHRAIRGEAIDIWGDGSITRDYIYIRDLADAFATALTYRGNKTVFNVGTGIGTSLDALIRIIEEVLGKAVARRYMPGRVFDVPVNILDSSLIKQEMAWSPKVSLRDGIARTAAWLQREPQ